MKEERVREGLTIGLGEAPGRVFYVKIGFEVVTVNAIFKPIICKRSAKKKLKQKFLI
jgi:hypothetical protein